MGPGDRSGARGQAGSLPGAGCSLAGAQIQRCAPVRPWKSRSVPVPEMETVLSRCLPGAAPTSSPRARRGQRSHGAWARPSDGSCAERGEAAGVGAALLLPAPTPLSHVPGAAGGEGRARCQGHPPSSASPTSPTTGCLCSHRRASRGGQVMRLEVAVVPQGWRASSLPCRCPVQTGPAPVTPRALLAQPLTPCHPFLQLVLGASPTLCCATPHCLLQPGHQHGCPLAKSPSSCLRVRAAPSPSGRGNPQTTAKSGRH